MTPQRRATTPEVSVAELMLRAFAAQTAENLDEAERLYRSALAENAENFDALHMLGVIRLQRGDAEGSVRLLLAALPLLRTDYPAIYRNLGLCLGAVARKHNLVNAAADETPGNAHLRFFRRGNLPARPPSPPSVSIVMRCHNGAANVDAAVQSVVDQNYRNLELIVVDDGSQDGSAEVIAQALARVSFPSQFLRLEQPCAHAALNEGIAAATGHYVGLLEADGVYAAERIEKFVRLLAGVPAQWGFSNIRFIDSQSKSIMHGEREHVDTIIHSYDALYSCRALSAECIDRDCIVTAGNLFFERSLWHEVGGFPPFHHYYGWAFGLSAASRSEPAYLDEPAYLYRIPETPLNAETMAERDRERVRMHSTWDAQTPSVNMVRNPMLVEAILRRRDSEIAMMAGGVGHLVDRKRLLRFASELGFGTAHETYSNRVAH